MLCLNLGRNLEADQSLPVSNENEGVKNAPSSCSKPICRWNVLVHDLFGTLHRPLGIQRVTRLMPVWLGGRVGGKDRRQTGCSTWSGGNLRRLA